MNILEIALMRKTEIETELKKLETFLEVAEELQRSVALEEEDAAQPEQPMSEATPEPVSQSKAPSPEASGRGIPFSDPVFQKILAEDRRRHGLAARHQDQPAMPADDGKMAANF